MIRARYVVAVAVVIGASAFIVQAARGPEVRTALVTRRDIEKHVVASGRVWVPTRVEVAAQLPGLVVAVMVREGARVKAGDLLVQLDDSESRAAFAQAKASVDQARARVELLRRVGAIVATEDLKQAQTNLERADSDLQRATKLAASGAVSRVDLDNAERAANVARAQRTAAEAQQISSSPLGADSRVALTALLQAEAQLAGAQARLSQTKVLASKDGVVLTRSVEPGEVVQPSRTLLVLAAGGDGELVFEGDERNLASFALGQKARASADAYADQLFDATVDYIAPSIDPQRGSVEVRLHVSEPPPFLRPDMTVSVDVTVAQRSLALTLPSEAVREASSHAPWVLTVEGGHVARRAVKLGIRGDGTSEVLSGLPEGAEVVLPAGRPLLPGERVRTRREEPQVAL